ncbi:carbohydrate binding domain-containing protein [Kitasatospora sp. NPDC058201]|uniref:carbohydrate binding domain-containing protein n=1 Tax=unclassified Kitasatospora TaxID=2633591 RepID=UPI003653ABFE
MSKPRITAVGLALAMSTATLTATLASPAQAATPYYVDCSQTSTGDGSQARPWNTLAAVNTPAFGPGDSILFKRGSNCVGTFEPKGSGAAGAPITVGAYGTGALPQIDGHGAVDTVLLTNQEYWEIRDLSITNAHNPGTARNGVRVTGVDAGKVLHHIVLQRLNIHDILGNDEKGTDGSNGISIASRGTTTPDKFDDVQILDNTITNVDRTGITTASNWSSPTNYYPHTGVVIRGNTLTDIGGDGIVAVVTSGALVEYNTIAGFNTTSTRYNAGIWPYRADHTVIQYNDISGGVGLNDSMGLDIDDLTDNTLVQYNYTHDNDGGFLLLCTDVFADSFLTNAVVRYNVSQNDEYRGVENCGGNIGSAHIYNNTIIVKPGANMTVIRESATGLRNVRFDNNVVYNTGALADAKFDFSPTTGYNLRNNLFYRTTTAPGTGTVTTDPQLAAPDTGPNGYKLCVGSQAIGNGLTIPDNGGKDYYGNPIPAGAPHRGAFAGTPVVCNKVLNGGFETGTLTGWANSNAAVGAANARTGGYAVTLTATSTKAATVEQTITGLTPNTTYALDGWIKSDGNETSIGVKGYGGTQVSGYSSATSYTPVATTFTTGATNTTATVFCYHAPAGTASCDDIAVRKPLVANGGFETGTLTGWTSSNAVVGAANTRSGSYAVTLTATATRAATVEQTLTGLLPATSYNLIGWVKSDGGTTSLGVKGHGGTQAWSSTTASTYTPRIVNFTTGPTSTSAVVYCYRPGSGTASCDDITLSRN